MKPSPARQTKRERLTLGVKHALEQRLALAKKDGAGTLVVWYSREHALARLLAERYVQSVASLCEAFPDGDAPDDVLECHVDALTVHDEEYAKKLFGTEHHFVLVLRATQSVVRRAYVWLDEGDLLSLGGRRFKVVKVSRERTDDVSLDEARREGFASIEEWRRAWAEGRPRPPAAALRPSEELCWRHELAALDDVK
jgi:hypothetical protein